MSQNNKKDFAAPTMLVSGIPEIGQQLSVSDDWGMGEFSLRKNTDWSVGEINIE